MRSWYFLLLFFSSLQADFTDYLKKAVDKSNDHSIANIDFIYMINLDQRPEKFQNSLDQLAPYGIRPYRFSAVNGWELTLENLDEIGLKFWPGMVGGFLGTCYPSDLNFQPSHEQISEFGKTYFCHCMSRGAIGIALSHISVLQDAYDSGYNTIWVMEDDIDVMGNPRRISDIVEKLDQFVGPENWDVLFTDRDIRNAKGHYVTTYWAGRRPDFFGNNDYALKRQVSPHFIKVGARSGAHSMIIRRSGIEKLLEFFFAHQIFFPYDMEYILPSGINLYTVTEDIVSNSPQASSDNGEPNYLKKGIR